MRDRDWARNQPTRGIHCPSRTSPRGHSARGADLESGPQKRGPLRTPTIAVRSQEARWRRGTRLPHAEGVKNNEQTEHAKVHAMVDGVRNYCSCAIGITPICPSPVPRNGLQKSGSDTSVYTVRRLTCIALSEDFSSRRAHQIALESSHRKTSLRVLFSANQDCGLHTSVRLSLSVANSQEYYGQPHDRYTFSARPLDVHAHYVETY